MRLLVSSAKGANGAGYGAILAFDFVGNALGTFCDDSRVADPRGLCVDPSGDLLDVNNGNDRVLALDQKGQVLKTPADQRTRPRRRSLRTRWALLRGLPSSPNHHGYDGAT